MRPEFVPFDRTKAIRVYRRNLPHWRQEGATYFVTFRLRDSIPESARERIQHEENLWLKARRLSTKLDRSEILDMLNVRDQFLYRQHLNRLREDVNDKGHGDCFLDRIEVITQLHAQIFADDKDCLHIGDFIIMPNYVHMLIVPQERELELCMKRIKGSSATLCNRILQRTGIFWQADTFDHIVRNIEQRKCYREYIADNAKKAGIKIPDIAYYRAEWM